MGEIEVTQQTVESRLDRLLEQAESNIRALQQARAQVAELQQENTRLQQENTRLQEEKQALHEQLARLLAAVERAPQVVNSQEAIPRMIRQALTVPSAPANEHRATEPPAKRPSDRELLARWCKRYPKAFSDVQVQPLQVGIHAALVEREGLPEQWVKRALASYVRLPKYLKVLRVGAVRLDLDGNNAGFVTEQEARHAREQLQQLRERRAARERRQAQQVEQQRMQQKLAQLINKPSQ